MQQHGRPAVKISQEIPFIIHLGIGNPGDGPDSEAGPLGNVQRVGNKLFIAPSRPGFHLNVGNFRVEIADRGVACRFGNFPILPRDDGGNREQEQAQESSRPAEGTVDSGPHGDDHELFREFYQMYDSPVTKRSTVFMSIFSARYFACRSIG